MKSRVSDPVKVQQWSATVRDVPERNDLTGCSRPVNCCIRRLLTIRWCSLCHSNWLNWHWAIVG